MNTFALEVAVILLMILMNGLLAMSEIAIVSSRKFRLQQRLKAGSSGAGAALELADNPGRFLSTVQIGITLVGILAGAYGGATMAEQLVPLFGSLPINWLAQNSQAVSVGLVVVLITFFSLVLGELAPKQIALTHPENIAIAVSPLMQQLSRLAAPLVRFLSASSSLVLKALRVHPADDSAVTEEEIKLLIEQGTLGGIIEPEEERILEQVFWLADRRVTSVMTPRPDIGWLDLDAPLEESLAKLATREHSAYPVAHGDLDHLEGLVLAKDLLAESLQGKAVDLKASLIKPVYVTENISVLQAVQQFRSQRTHIAFVIDEFGGIQGLVTTTDFLEAMVGGFPDSKEEPEILQRQDGSWLLDGMLPIIEFRSLFEISPAVDEQENLYQTLGGFMMASLGRIPREGDVIEWANLRFEVLDMDRLRVDKVLVTPLNPTP